MADTRQQWTGERFDELAGFLALGMTYPQIAEKMGLPRNSVASAAARIKRRASITLINDTSSITIGIGDDGQPIGQRPELRRPIVLSDEAAKKLVEMRREGISTAQCAKFFKISADVMTKLCNKHGVGGLMAWKKPPAPTKPKRNKAAHVAESDGGNIVLPDGFKVDEHVFSAIPESRSVTIVDLGSQNCRWPLGDPLSDEFRYCGADRVVGSSYCECHAGIARGKGTPSERAALKGIRA